MKGRISGIYCIENVLNGKKYIGLSCNIYKRWEDHRSKAFCSKKKEDIDKPLYKAFRKYGLENFTFRIIEECESSMLAEREIYWIQYYDSYNKGYNATLGGDMPSENALLKGEEHGMHKLTEQQVIECRLAYQAGERSRQVWEAKYANIMTYAGFQRMWLGKTWKHVMPEVFENNPHPRRKFSDQEIIEIKKMFADGKSCADVFHFFNGKYSRTTINDIYHGRRYADIKIK